jgi:glutathione S-transferase
MMADTPLVLCTDNFWISPYVYSCFVALTEKRLTFETVHVALERKEQLRPEYKSHTITGKVPALRHGDFWLAESSAIVEYLDETFPGPRLLPEDKQQRARARQVMAFLRSDLLALREERPTTTMFYERAKSPLTPAGQAAATKLIDIADRLIADGATSLFPSWSVADSDLAFMLERLILNRDPVPPKLKAFADVQWQRPSVRAFVERTRLPYQPY